MATVRIPVDAGRLTLISTGRVHKVAVWAAGQMVENEQERDRDTGMPLWSIDVVIDDTDENRRSEAMGVRVPALDAPTVSKWQPVVFEGLEVAVRTNKAGGLSAYWNAAGIASGHVAAIRPVKASGE